MIILVIVRVNKKNSKGVVWNLIWINIIEIRSFLISLNVSKIGDIIIYM